MSLAKKKDYTPYFHWFTLFKGEDYFKRGNVLHWTLDGRAVIGKVSGSGENVYTTWLYFAKNGSALDDTECSCPIGGNCKHAAALLLAFQSTGDQQEEDDDIDQQTNEAAIGNHSEPESSQASVAPSNPIPPSAPASLKVLKPTEPHVVSRPPKREAQFHFPNEVQKSFQHIAALLYKSQDNEVVPDRTKPSRTRLIYLLSKYTNGGGPAIEIKSVSLRKDGSFGSMHNVSLERILSRSPAAYVGSEDVEIAKLWYTISNCGKPNWYYSYTSSLPDSLNPRLFFALFERILKTNRCYLEGLTNQPLKLAKSLSGALDWMGKDGQWHISVVAKDGDSNFPCLRWNIPYYVDTVSGACGPVELGIEPDVIKALYTMRALTDDEAKRLPLLLQPLGLLDLIPPPPCVGKIEERRIIATPQLNVEQVRVSPELLVGDLSIPHEQLRVAVLSTKYPRSPEQPYIEADGTIVTEVNDQETLATYPKRLEELGFREIDGKRLGMTAYGKRYFVRDNLSTWADIDREKIDGLRTDGWEISGETERKLLPLEADPESLEFKAESESNWWFSLSLHIEVEGKRISLFPLLISAIKRLRAGNSMGESIDALNHNGKFVVSQADGTLICLPFERMRSALKLVQELVEKDLKADKIAVVDALEFLQDETLGKDRWIGFEKILKFVEKLKALQSIEQVDGPEQFETKLRPYQLEGLSWLNFLAQESLGGILADDMGLGKTVQLLAEICLEKEKGQLRSPYLVICPTSVLPNWMSETAKFAPQLNAIPYYGAGRHGDIFSFKKADLVITTYALLARDLDTLKKFSWHGVVLDEAQNIKNHTTKLAQAARSLTAKRRFCLTGTPVENHLGELWSQFQFLLPGLLGDHESFKRVFRDPIEKLGDRSRMELLARRIKPFILRRTKKDVAAELPDKIVIVQKVELAGNQRDLYESVRLASTKQVRDEIKKKGFKHSRIMILDALLKLRQACCHPKLVKLSAAERVKESAKTDLLLDMLEQLVCEGRKILLFSQFASMISMIEEELNRRNLPFVTITGATKDRRTPVEQFQNGDVPIFLISLKAGGTGLNLTAADVVIHYDPWWNPAVEDQATDRAHRIGQTKKVFVYKLISKGTIEERMIQLQESKRALAESIYDKEGNLGKSFSEEDLEFLLRPLDDVIE